MGRSRGKLVVAILGITILFSMGFLIQASAVTTDPGCTNGDCPPDPGCTNGDCPPDPGCTNGDCPPDPGCTNGDCPPDPGCTDGDCPPDPGCTDGDCPQGTVAFKLTGAEVFKGIDIGPVRFGTTFLGRVFKCDSFNKNCVDVGYWKSFIRYTGTENIEVCDGTNDILAFTMDLIFVDGTYAGKRLVLSLADSNDEDVLWEYKAPICGPAIQDPACRCPNDPAQIESWNCDEPMTELYGPVAVIPNLMLQKSWGSTLNITGADLFGLLCHNWRFIPRVGGVLHLYLN